MTLLAWTVWLAAGLAALALAASALAHVHRPARAWARRGPVVAAAGVAGALLVLAAAFLRGDVSIFYVWENVDQAYPWWLRVAGIWGGQAGTFLLWAGVVLAASAIQQRRATGATWRRVRTVLLAVATLLLAAPVALHLGTETALYGLTAEGGFRLGAAGPAPTSVRPSGDGLNPLLESPYMSIHPFVEFLAYGLASVPFAYALVHLFTGAPFREAAGPWIRAAWATFLAALTLGGLWAYNVLSFGGYWIWDPVEVANLLPFLALTTYLHAEPVHRRGYLGLLTPAAAVLAFVFILFASFVTRTGLWSSVHAFLPTGLSIAIEDPMQRLTRAVAAGFQPAYATRLFAGGLGAAATGFAAAHARAHGGNRGLAWALLAGLYGLVGLAGLLAPGPTVAVIAAVASTLAFGRPLVGVSLVVVFAALPLVYALLRAPEDTPVSVRERGGQLTLAAALLALIAVATGALLVLGVNGYRANVFWSRAPLLAAPVLGLIGLTFGPRAFEHRLGLVGLGLAGGLLAFFVTRSWAWAALVLAGAVLVGLAGRFLARARPTGDARARLRTGLLALAGVLGLVQWASPGAVTVAGVTLASPAAYVPVGLLAAVAVLGLAVRDEGPRWLAPAVGVLAVGYGVGALAALVAGLADRSQGAASWRAAGLAVIHAGLALLVLGVGVSTYAAAGTSFEQADPLVRGEPAGIGDHEIQLVDGEVVDPDGDGRPQTVAATVHVSRDGTFVEEERLSLSFSPATGFAGQGSFVPDGSPAVRTWWGDVALNADTSTPLAIRVDGPGTNATWVVANGPMPADLTGEVQAVSMGVERLPGVNLVWASIGLIAVGFGARVGRRT